MNVFFVITWFVKIVLAYRVVDSDTWERNVLLRKKLKVMASWTVCYHLTWLSSRCAYLCVRLAFTSRVGFQTKWCSNLVLLFFMGGMWWHLSIWWTLCMFVYRACHQHGDNGCRTPTFPHESASKIRSSSLKSSSATMRQLKTLTSKSSWPKKAFGVSMGCTLHLRGPST